MLPRDRYDDNTIQRALRAWPEAWSLDRLAGEREADVVRRELWDDPLVSHEDFGRLVEEAAEADDAHMLRAEREFDEAERHSRSPEAGEIISTWGLDPWRIAEAWAHERRRQEVR